MAENFYQMLKRYRDEKRRELEKVSPEPRHFMGNFSTAVAEAWPKTEIYNRAVMTATKIAMSTIVNAAEELGWEKWINLLAEKQQPSALRHNKRLAKELNITGNTVADAAALGRLHAYGCGFKRHIVVAFTDSYVEGCGDWCPQIQVLHEMGLADKAENLSLWCDTFDRFIMAVVNPNIYYVHFNCLGRGDRYCRFVLQEFKEDNKGESFYHRIKRHSVEKRNEYAKVSSEPKKVPGFGKRWRGTEDWTDEYIGKRGSRTEFYIAHDNILLAASEIGWERFINLIAEKQLLGFKEAALARKRDFEVAGNTLQEAGILVALGFAGSTFDRHQIIEYTDKRIEGVGESCPIVEAAKELGIENKIGELSLWCDFYHNFDVHAAHESFELTFTHCLGRGDKYCRFVIE